MTASNRFDRVFGDVLSDLAQPNYPDYIEDALDRATQRSQRPVWTFPERWLPMGTIARTTPLAPGLPWRNLAILMLLLLAAAIAAFAIGSQPAPAPPYGPAGNGVITYQLDGDIYTRPVVGGEPSRITDGPEVDVTPVFSRDGTKLAFVRIDPEQEAFGTANEQASLVIANADGDGIRPLIGPAVFSSWVWSPDGQSMAMIAPTARGPQLSVVPIDGGEPRVFAFEAPIVSGGVEWRPPDGRELILQLASGGRARFFAVPVDGGEVRQITPTETVLPAGGLFTLTPDGRQLVYEHTDPVITLRIVDVETGVERLFGQNLPPLVGGEVHTGAPSISSDGTRLIFGRYWDGDGSMINHQMWTASLAGDGSDAAPIGPRLRSPGGMLPFVTTTAPDGTRVIVHRTGSGETWSTDLTGEDLQTLDLGDFEWADWQRVAP